MQDVNQENKLIVTEGVVTKPSKRVPPRVRSFNSGMDDGRSAAARDYLQSRVDLETFNVERDFKDHYGVGYELGYLTKLAEIVVG